MYLVLSAFPIQHFNVINQNDEIETKIRDKIKPKKTFRMKLKSRVNVKDKKNIVCLN